jgi:glyoxylase-like metal-dependent hydrolase (beta-lactamase superfamily II)
VSLPSREEIDVVVLGPGFGECILIHIGEGDWIVFDSCLQSGTDRSAALVYLDSIGVKPETAIKLICASHWHDDHVGGLARLLGL